MIANKNRSTPTLTLSIFVIQNAVEHLQLVNTNKVRNLLLFPRFRRGSIKN